MAVAAAREVSAFQPPQGAATIETEVRIAAPVSTVWAILTAFEDYRTWNRYMLRIDGAAAAGARIVVTTRDAGSEQEINQTISVESIEPYSMHWVGGTDDLARFRGDHFFELVPLDADNTIILHREYFTGTLAAAIMANFGSAIRRNFEVFNMSLKTRAEEVAP